MKPNLRADELKELKKTRRLLSLFMIGLTLSGITAFPLETELALGNELLREFNIEGPMSRWLEVVYNGVKKTNFDYPFIAYGTDWLAFAHIILAILFIGPYRDPIRNIWVIHFGLIACAAVFPLAFIAGEIRNIPLMWRLIDCSFGVVGGAILIKILLYIKNMERIFVMSQIKA
jgi:hypothetical protein